MKQRGVAAAEDGVIPRVDVLGVGISAIDMPTAVEEVSRWVTYDLHRYVCVTGMHGVMEAQKDPELVRIHNRSGLTTPDGMPMVWASRLAGLSDVERVYGPDLMLALSRRAAERGWRCYFYGATQDVLDKLEANLTARFPGLRVVGSYSPPFREVTEEEDRRIVDAINEAEPDIVWVGLSTPKQERWMAAHIDRVKAPVLIGVGAAFDIHAGNLRQAPRWMQRAGLEWLFRLGCEPRRLWRRYVYNIPRFLLALVRRRPRVRAFAESPRTPEVPAALAVVAPREDAAEV